MLGEKLKRMRNELKLSQREVAQAIGIPRDTYAQYEMGRRNPNYNILKKLANFHGVTVDYLLDNDVSLDDTGVAVMLRARNLLGEKSYDDLVEWTNAILEGLVARSEKDNGTKEK